MTSVVSANGPRNGLCSAPHAGLLQPQVVDIWLALHYSFNGTTLRGILLPESYLSFNILRD